MVFLAGPRLVGKTTMIKQILETWRDREKREVDALGTGTK